MEHKVVITGLGAVSSIGLGVERFTRALRAGECAAADIQSFSTEGFATRRGCEVKGFCAGDWLRRVDPALVGRSSQFAVAAARMALEDAGLDAAELDLARIGVCLGTTDGESQLIDRLARQSLEQGYGAVAREVYANLSAEQISLNVAREFALEGGASTILTACAAGNYATGYAFDRIMMGEVDMMLCGGADCMSRKTFAGFYRLGTIAPEFCQPFDRNRKGILTGEGAGVLLLESAASARARGARIYAEVLGYGMNCDAKHMVAPDRERIAACMRLAHHNASISADQVDWISAHGTGTIANDITEAGAIRDVFGDTPPPTSSVKSMIGHAMGAASALASVACAVGIHEGFIAPTINCVDPDPECGLDCVPNHAREAELKVVQNNGFAFGGNNCITVYGRWDG